MRRIIFFSWITCLLLSCSTRDIKRTRIIKSISEIGISFFNEWSFSTLTPNTKIWHKKDGPNTLYSLAFTDKDDKDEIKIIHPNIFLTEQKIPIPVGDEMPAIIYRFKDSIVFTKLDRRISDYRVGVITKKNDNPLFTENSIFNRLERIGKELDRIGVRYVESLNGRIRFTMLDGDTLTYLPDNIDENIRKQDLIGYKMIVPNWWYYAK